MEDLSLAVKLYLIQASRGIGGMLLGHIYDLR